MERQNNKVGDHALYCLAGLIILGLLSYLASKSPVVIHRLSLPVLSTQSKLFALCLFDNDLENEHRRISRIASIMDREVKRGGYKKVNPSALRSAVRKASKKTVLTARCLAAVFFISAGSLMIVSTINARGTLYGRRENIHVPRLAGVEGFIRVVGGYLDGEVISALRRSPAPERLVSAFDIARRRTNIPCCVVGWLFPRGSAERLALLEYGKTNVVFAQEKSPAVSTGAARKS